MTTITHGPDGQTRFDGMTVGEMADSVGVSAILHRHATPPDVALANRYDAIAAALRHLSEWQPIETAPRDGTPVDLWYVPYTGSQRRMPDRWWVNGKGWRTSPGPDFMPDRMFTAWRPPPSQRRSLCQERIAGSDWPDGGHPMTAPAPDRRCGTCKWWEATTHFQITGDRWGKCEWSTANMPQSLRDTRDMQQDAGTDCSQWSDGAEALGETTDG